MRANIRFFGETPKPVIDYFEDHIYEIDSIWTEEEHIQGAIMLDEGILTYFDPEYESMKELVAFCNENNIGIFIDAINWDCDQFEYITIEQGEISGETFEIPNIKRRFE